MSQNIKPDVSEIKGEGSALVHFPLSLTPSCGAQKNFLKSLNCYFFAIYREIHLRIIIKDQIMREKKGVMACYVLGKIVSTPAMTNPVGWSETRGGQTF